MNQRLIIMALCAMLLLPAASAFMQESSGAQEFVTPVTSDYLVFGLAVVALILGIWVVRMIVRFRTLHQDEATLEALEGDSTND